MTEIVERSGGDELFALLQRALPQHWLSKGMHALARSRQRPVRNALIRTVLRGYPQIDMHEALQPDPFAYPSFNAFFTRELRPDARPIADDADCAVSPVDGTVSQLGRTDAGKLVQAKGMDYTADALLADTASAARYVGGSFACLYLAPYNYHRIHMPLDGVLRATRYVPGQLFSVNASTARSVPQLFARNERLVCLFDTAHGPMAVVMVGAMLVSGVETVWRGVEIPPYARDIQRHDYRGHEPPVTIARGGEMGRFNFGSTVIVLLPRGFTLDPSLAPEQPVRMGQRLAAPAKA